MMRSLRALLMILGLLAAFALTPQRAEAAGPTCHGKFANPITDVCWSCLFPLSVGGTKIWPGNRPDTGNPASPICACADPLPRIGISVGFWEPARLADVTMKPWCLRTSPRYETRSGSPA